MSMNEDRLFELAKEHSFSALSHIENGWWLDAEPKPRGSHSYTPDRVSAPTNLGK